MSEVVVVGVLSLIGTLVGTLGGIFASNKLVTFRLESLEKKVQAHNNLVERMYRVEGKVEEITHDIRDLKRSA